MTYQEDIKELILEHNRRLQILKKREAQQGVETPPSVIIEIEDTEAKIEILEAELEKLATELKEGDHGKPQITNNLQQQNASTIEPETDRLLRFRKTLIESLDIEEFRDLCFNLGVDYDGLRGEGLDGKTRELISYLRRRNSLDKLVTTLQKTRPDIKI